MDFTRRELGRLLTAAVPLASAVRAQDSARPAGYCIVGLGRISMDHFMPGVKMSQRARITGIVSGHRDKAEKMAAEYGVPASGIYSYDNYDTIAANKEIDA